MKFFVVALSLVAICSAATMNDLQKAVTIGQDCAIKFGLSSNDVDEYNKEMKNYVDDPNAQNFFKCTYQKTGFIDQNGDFQESVAIEKLTTGDIVFLTEEQLKQCTETAGDNKTNAYAIKLAACYSTAVIKNKELQM